MAVSNQRTGLQTSSARSIARNEMQGFLRINTECACGIPWGISSDIRKGTLRFRLASPNHKENLKNEKAHI